MSTHMYKREGKSFELSIEQWISGEGVKTKLALLAQHINESHA